MPAKPIELPLEVAKAFIAVVRAFFAAKDGIKKDEIAARQQHLLLELSRVAFPHRHGYPIVCALGRLSVARLARCLNF
jgi:hypothetical protein